MKKTYLYFGNRLPKMASRRFPGASLFGSAAYKTDAEIAAEEKQKKDAKAITDKETELKALKIEKPEDFTKAFQLYKEIAELKGKNLDEKLAAIEEAQRQIKEAAPEVTAEQHKKVVEDLASTVRALDIVQARVKNQKSAAAPQHEKSFNEILGDTIERYADQIRGFKRGGSELKMDMMPDHKEKGADGVREVKTVGDMSISANFSTSTTWTIDRSGGMIEKPYNRVWLADVLPQGTSSGSSVIYPKENGGEGGAALWTDPTADKAQMDFDFTTQSAYFKWIAGWVVIAREMLDDIPFLLSYLQNKMLISLKIAENDFILNGSTDTNPVSGMLDVATVYHGNYSNDVDRYIDSGWGQIVTDTFDFYNPTHIILTPNNAVKVMLNKAGGSGEYDLPNNSVQIANSGALSLSGIDVVRTTQIGEGNFLTFDRRALMFIRRMQPELRMFEDSTLAKKNKIMFRVEERATLAIFNNLAIVSGGAGS